MMKWLKTIVRGRQHLSPEEFYLLCSTCSIACPQGDAHVIPWWNTDMKDFVTTYRCAKCWLRSLRETREKVSTPDANVREKFCDFLERHGYISDAAVVREASLEDSAGMMRRILDAIESQTVRLSP
jgi:hypothetical protein